MLSKSMNSKDLLSHFSGFALASLAVGLVFAIAGAVAVVRRRFPLRDGRVFKGSDAIVMGLVSMAFGAVILFFGAAPIWQPILHNP
jgi:hypothetical protein